ncbi:MAG: 5-bromo-4-chloroindolyl phosphate hydrolysis family protein [Peptococcaceae bacterium]|nr:5-bromo-4-chloroindolyl phosphate hydrolysis family protein [Peptococcaceae bacterium]
MGLEKEIKKLVKYWLKDIIRRNAYNKLREMPDAFKDDIFKSRKSGIKEQYRETKDRSFEYQDNNRNSHNSGSFEKKENKTKTYTPKGRFAGLPMLILGVSGLAITGIGAIVLAILAMLINTPLFGIILAFDFSLLVLFGIVTASGVSTMRLSNRIRRLTGLLQDKNIIPVNEVAQITGQTPAEVIRDIRQATRKVLLSEVRLDDEETTVLYGKDAYKEYLRYKRNKLEHAAAEQERLGQLGGVDPAELARFKAIGEDALRKIRAANDDLTEEDISEKLYKLENIVGKIFSYVMSHPAKLPLTRKFTEYYLPTTLKLTDKYSHFDKTDAESVKGVQDEIKNTFDTVYKAFCNLLDQLAEEDVLDVSTDIKVLETMLAREGLAGNKFEIGRAEGMR